MCTIILQFLLKIYERKHSYRTWTRYDFKKMCILNRKLTVKFEMIVWFRGRHTREHVHPSLEFSPKWRMLGSRTLMPSVSHARVVFIRTRTSAILHFASSLYMWLDLTKPTIGHLRHWSSSLDWSRNSTTILNAKGASTKVSDGGFCQIGSHICISLCMYTLLGLRNQLLY